MTPKSHPAANPSPLPTPCSLLVVGFCAAWCNTCEDFRNAFDALAAERPEARFVWLDIEDDSDMVGEIDVENFPTIAVFIEDRLVHFGVSLPQGAVLGRLLDSFDVGSKTVEGHDAIAGLPRRLASRTPLFPHARPI